MTRTPAAEQGHRQLLTARKPERESIKLNNSYRNKTARRFSALNMTTRQSNQPSRPNNAVTNQSARRKGQVSNKPAKNQNSVEVASWSQSKRWLSSETRERKAFQKMMLNLQFMKADQSPFVPKTPAELTKFKISLAEAKRLKLAREVSALEEKNRQREMAKASGSKPVSQPQALLFNGREMEDKLSPVFAARNCFNKEDTAEANHRVEWPSLAELKEEGDKRARFGRYLPLPRMNVVAPKILEREQEGAYNADGSIL
ncbi:40S ribosomal s8 [Trichoderma cornu-damae]|uniref:40S ribosomal s8 n=1 Tax=Trichoderma cornu-damae TaxID=654480 RepID=A0A9P8TU31_9HYPO|nr:40S ribosomal s8 [Trichoderma cornu-damae]